MQKVAFLHYMTKIEKAGIALQQGDFRTAQQMYLDIINTQPALSPTIMGKAYYGLGFIAQQQHQWPQAIDYFQPACRLLGAQTAPLLGLANAFNHVFSEVDALTVLQHAHQRHPKDEHTLYALIQQLIILGELDQAVIHLPALLNAQNNALFAHAMSDALKLSAFNQTRLFNTEHISRCNGLIDSLSNQLSAETAMGHTENKNTLTTLHYVLAELAYQHHNMQEAMQHWQKANTLQLQLCHFRVKDMVPFFSSLVKIPKQISYLEKSSLVNEHTPIFIVGLPRTGSTLIESQLSQHPDIGSVGEVNYLSECVHWLCEQTQLPYPECIEHITDEMLQQARTLYYDAIAQHRLHSPLIINKLPANYQSIPIIIRLFPSANIIHCVRDKAMTALSIYRNNFAQNEPYFCDLPELATYMSHYETIMETYSTLYPDAIHTVSYEAFVTDKQVQIQHIYQYLGIVDKRVANDSERQTATSSVVKTLSAIQVRQPIYQSSTTLPEELLEYFRLFTAD